MNQTQLAEILDVSPQFISKWKLGQTGLKVSTAIRWSAILNVDFNVLMTAKPDPKTRARLLGLSADKED